MIIDEIKIYNFGIFHGVHSITFTPPSKTRNVSLVGGLNGAGKTTLLDALYIGFFGKLSVTNGRTSSSYDDILRKFINKKADPEDGAYIQISFRTINDGVEVKHKLFRSWSVNGGNKVREQLDVFTDNELDEALSSTWLENVERFIPERLCQVFFFDGERIEALADKDQSSKVLSTAINSLLGLDLVSQLMIDLRVIEARKLKKQKNQADLAIIEDLESKIKILSNRKLVLISERTKLERSLSKCNREFEKTDNLFSQKGGWLINEHEVLRESKIKAKTNLESIREELRGLASGPLPLALLSGSLKSILAQVSASEEVSQANVILKYIDDRDKALIGYLQSQRIDSKALDGLIALLDKYRPKTPNLPDPTHSDLGSAEINKLRTLLDVILDDQVKHAKNMVKADRKAQRLLDDIDTKLAQVPDEDSIKDVFKAREISIAEISEIRTRLQFINEDQEKVERERSDLVSKLNEVLRTKKSGDLDDLESERFLYHTELSKKLLQKYHETILKKNIGRLEDIIIEKFKRLLRKKSLVNAITIDPNDFSLTIYNGEKQVVDPDELSAGERQLLAVSLLWGFGQASGRPLPVFIDTPLSRLDASHRDNLVDRYFPSASHQVVLLSTDEEITRKYYKRLKKHVGNEYTLVFDERTGSSKVKRGYFFSAGAK